jgi:hypothetical protein
MVPDTRAVLIPSTAFFGIIVGVEHRQSTPNSPTNQTFD